VSKTYIDKQGYARFSDSDKSVHRWVAYKEIYSKHQSTYPLPFSSYQVHHKDGNIRNNNASNLKLVERGEQAHNNEYRNTQAHHYKKETDNNIIANNPKTILIVVGVILGIILFIAAFKTLVIIGIIALVIYALSKSNMKFKFGRRKRYRRYK
jgi:hypothetical protein